MKTGFYFRLAAVLIMLLFLTINISAQLFFPGTASQAIESAEKSGKYIFLLFYNNKDNSVDDMERITRNFINGKSQKTAFYKSSVRDNKDADIISKFRISPIHLPLLLVLAPNGAVTGGFSKTVSQQQLEQCIVTKLAMDILKSLQQGKLVVVCLENSRTKDNKKTKKAVDEFANIPQLKGYVTSIKTDPDKNNDFLIQCNIDKKVIESTVVLLVPPNTIAGVFKGDMITKESLTAALSSCSSGSSGCCPK